MKQDVEFPIQAEWDLRVMLGSERLNSGARTVRISRRDAELAHELVRRTVYHCMRDGCDRPAFILCGWRTYLGLSHALSGEHFVLAKEMDGVPVICDPSREYFVQAIERLRHIGRSRGPFAVTVNSQEFP